MDTLDCSTLASCHRSAESIISDLTAQWRAATGFAIFFGLFIFIAIYHLMAKFVFWYRRRGMQPIASDIDLVEMGPSPLDLPESTRYSDSDGQSSSLTVQRRSVSAETVFQQDEEQHDYFSRGLLGSETYRYYQQEEEEEQQPLDYFCNASSSRWSEQEDLPNPARPDLISVTQYGITLHSVRSPLRPKPRYQYMQDRGVYDLQSPLDMTPRADFTVVFERRSSMQSMDEQSFNTVSSPFSFLSRRTKDTIADSVEEIKWPFFKNDCVLEEGMLEWLFGE